MQLLKLKWSIPNGYVNLNIRLNTMVNGEVLIRHVRWINITRVYQFLKIRSTYNNLAFTFNMCLAKRIVLAQSCLRLNLLILAL